MYQDLDDMRAWMTENDRYCPEGEFLGLGHRFTETRPVVPAGTADEHDGPVWELEEPWDGDQPIMIPTGMEDCVIGVCRHPDGCIAVLSQDKVLKHLERDMGVDAQGALEWFEFNTIGAWIGQDTPIFMEYPGE